MILDGAWLVASATSEREDNIYGHDPRHFVRSVLPGAFHGGHIRTCRCCPQATSHRLPAVVVENFVNPAGETVAYRRGWHAGGSTGFGYDKVSRKHAITNVQIVHSVVRHPPVVRQETPTRWVHEKEALLVGLAGPSQSVVVRVVIEYGDWAGPGQMGVVTAYCVGIQGKCPEWVNRAFSID
jgi:hypothetical protein